MRARFMITLATLILTGVGSSPAQNLPVHLRDRGTGVPLSQFGTYVKRGELLLYPFFEWYYDRDLEYKPSELGYGLEVDHRGRYRKVCCFSVSVSPRIWR